MKYFKKFDQHSQYEQYISGNPVLPNVSVCVNDEHVHYNPAPSADFIDLGLPSGRLWCSHNVGAEAETDYGDYFMWGSTTPDTDNVCDWAHAPFNNGQSNFDETYFASVSGTVCPNGVLALEYDAAHAQMGGDWRMPTKADFDELLSGTTSVWVTNYQGSGVNGRLFTSKTNGNTMFIPAAGNRSGSSFTNQGNDGYVWNSLLHTYDPYAARGLNFNSSYCNMSSGGRYCGFSVRGVL